MRNVATLERDQEQGKPARIHEQGAEIYQEQDETTGQTAQTITPAPLQKWTSQAGPRQTLDTEKALKKLTKAGHGTIERHNYGDMIVFIMGEDTPAENIHRAQVHEVLNAIHAKHGGTITAANCRAIIADCAEAFPALENSRPVVDLRQTPEQEAAEKATLALIHATANAKHKEAEAIRQTAAAEEEAAKPENFGLIRTPPDGHACGVHAAKNIRFVLKKNFPGQTFSVTADYSSVRIHWSNGPTVDEVEKHVKTFQEGNFDGMDDSYHFRHSAFLDAFGGVQYVFPGRRIDEEVRAQVEQEIRKHRPECLEHEFRTETQRALCRASMYNRGAFTGLDIVEGRLQAIFAELPQIIPATDKDRQGPAISSSSVRIEEHTHTKRGFQMFIVILSDRLEAAEFQALTATAKAACGWYSLAWGQTPGGFAFKDKVAAETFAASISGQNPRRIPRTICPQRARTCQNGARRQERAPGRPTGNPPATQRLATVKVKTAVLDEANARLIASAPDMLEACIFASRCATGPIQGMTLTGALEKVCSMLDNAIAKATGE
jgi:hypothetical protein